MNTLLNFFTILTLGIIYCVIIINETSPLCGDLVRRWKYYCSLLELVKKVVSSISLNKCLRELKIRNEDAVCCQRLRIFASCKPTSRASILQFKMFVCDLLFITFQINKLTLVFKKVFLVHTVVYISQKGIANYQCYFLWNTF